MADTDVIIATTVADAIRERLITYTPVSNGHQALILAYTRRQANALREFVLSTQLSMEPYRDVFATVEEAVTRSLNDGFGVPELPR